MALRDGLIGTRNTNRIDLEYFFYVPFAHWFSSDDGFHKSLYLALLQSNQFFSEGRVLKETLQEEEALRFAQFNLELPIFSS